VVNPTTSDPSNHPSGPLPLKSPGNWRGMSRRGGGWIAEIIRNPSDCGDLAWLNYETWGFDVIIITKPHVSINYNNHNNNI
jgi:hypothetical protein